MYLYIVPVKTGSVVGVDWLFYGLKVIFIGGYVPVFCTCGNRFSWCYGPVVPVRVCMRTKPL